MYIFPSKKRDLQKIVDSIHGMRTQKRPEVEDRLQKIKKLIETLSDTRRRVESVAASSPNLSLSLPRASFKDAEKLLSEASAACDAALMRLRRDSINIGVAGKARQGKSQILQMLTGLGDQQIPTGDGGFCTASRSVVRNGDAKSATVHYLTKSKLFKDKVLPSYAPVKSSDVALGLSPKPVSLDEFISAELPSVPDTAPVEALENWKKVRALQSDLRKNPELVSKLGSDPESIAIDTVRKYLVKDNGEADYQVVDHVEIVTPFEMDLPKGMTVYDLPGLEDPTPGIRETMLKSVSEDADIVLLLRMPKNTGDDWDNADLRTMNMLKEVFPACEVQPKDWIQLVLNLDKRPASNNEANVKRMNEKAPSGFRPVVCDCGSKDDVREMVDANIDVLVSQAGRIDDLRIRQADEAFHIALDKVKDLDKALRNVSGGVIAREVEFNTERKKETFMSDLRGPLKEDRSCDFRNMVKEVLDEYFKAAEKKFMSLCGEYEKSKDFPEELPIFPESRLMEMFNGGHGPIGTVERAVRNQREAVLKFLRDQLTKCCDKLVSRYFDCVVEFCFASNQALSLIEGVGTSDSREYLHNVLDAIRKSGTFENLVTDIQCLLDFRLTFEGSILPDVYLSNVLDDFNPERVVPDDASELAQIKTDIESIAVSPERSKKRAEKLYSWMKKKSEALFSDIKSGAPDSAVSRVSERIANTMLANYDTFVFRFIWGEQAETEWRRFVELNQAVFWKDEFDKATANSQLKKNWDAALEDLEALLKP